VTVYDAWMEHFTDAPTPMKEWKLKKTLFGHVLLVSNRVPSHSPGEWHNVWRKASKKDIKSFEYEIEELKQAHEELKQLKKNNPEYFV